MDNKIQESIEILQWLTGEDNPAPFTERETYIIRRFNEKLQEVTNALDVQIKQNERVIAKLNSFIK